jgi:hypothetical protein
MLPLWVFMAIFRVTFTFTVTFSQLLKSGLQRRRNQVTENI